MIRRKDSIIWDYFTSVSETSEKCNLCRSVFKHAKGSTSNLRRHMVSRHSTVSLTPRPGLSTVQPQPQEPEDEDQIIFGEGQQPPQSPQPHQLPQAQQPPQAQQIPQSQRPLQPQRTKQPVRSQSTIQQYLNRPVPSSKRKEIDQQLVRMICKEYHPFRLVEEPEFIKLMKLMNPGYELPSRKTVSSSLLPVLYEKVHAEVQEQIDKAKFVSITTDGWTSITHESFYAITAHFIAENGTLQFKLLSCERFPPDKAHDSQNIAQYLNQTFDEWGIVNKVVAVTTDNASVMVNAINQLGFRQIGCFAHTLNLVVQHSLKKISSVSLNTDWF
uniref:Zinc finger BED domain-containing protein 1 n=1 Tax=Cacopsylla melanoneura TaxID=428564 RepID=A0A8D8Z902_9HEMI